MSVCTHTDACSVTAEPWSHLRAPPPHTHLAACHSRGPRRTGESGAGHKRRNRSRRLKLGNREAGLHLASSGANAQGAAGNSLPRVLLLCCNAHQRNYLVAKVNTYLETILLPRSAQRWSILRSLKSKSAQSYGSHVTVSESQQLGVMRVW